MEPLHSIIDGSCIEKVRDVLQKGELRVEREREDSEKGDEKRKM